MKVSEAYGNIEKIVTFGFLPLGLRYGGHSFILKTVTDKEYKFLSFLAGKDNIDLALSRLAYSTYMIDGVNYLEDRSKQIPYLIDFYKRLPSSFFRKLIDVTNSIHEKYLKSVDCLEGFCYTNRSRHLWKVSQGNLPNLGFYHGISGAFNTGLNVVQENWTIINTNLDAEDDYEVQFRLSLMVASAFSGKGAKEMGGRFDFHKKELTSLREEIKKYGYDKKRAVKETRKDQWAKPIRTREDLVRELNRQMSGDMDRHDLFINEWVKGQAERAEAARKASEEKQKKFRETVLEDSVLEKMEPSRIATPEDIAKLTNARASEKPGVAVPSDAYKKTEEKDRVMKKLSGTVIRDNK